MKTVNIIFNAIAIGFAIGAAAALTGSVQGTAIGAVIIYAIIKGLVWRYGPGSRKRHMEQAGEQGAKYARDKAKRELKEYKREQKAKRTPKGGGGGSYDQAQIR